MADFQTSTHRAKWILTASDLFEKREAANWRARKMLEQVDININLSFMIYILLWAILAFFYLQYGSTRLEVYVDGSISYPEPFQDPKDSAAKPLNCEEEQLMRSFYEQKIQEVCGAFKFPHKIQGTAIMYFKRFYLQWSVMEHHPKHIMLTCIYASCKVEENHVSAEELGKGIQQDHQVILNNEMVVLQSLGFDLIVYPPYRSIEGLIEDIEEFVQARDAVKNKLKELQEVAKFEADKAMLTDAPLLFPPGQLALSALRKSNEMLNVIDFERYFETILIRQRNPHITSQLTESLNAIDLLVDKLAIPSAKDMRHIDRKLRSCLDPSAQDDGKKREKKSKHKSKRTSSEMQGTHIEG